MEYDPILETEKALDQEKAAAAYRMKLFDKLPRRERNYANKHGYPPGSDFSFWRLPLSWWRKHGRPDAVKLLMQQETGTKKRPAATRKRDRI